MDTLQQAADAAGISVDEAARNIVQSAGDRSPVGVSQTAADADEKPSGEEQREF
jgi:hypothetical protein